MSALLPRLRESIPALNVKEFEQLAEVPAELEWFANLDNPQTRRAYRTDIREFQSFAGITAPEQFRLVARGHVLAWRKTLEVRALSRATVRRKLAALSSLFEYLCERNALSEHSSTLFPRHQDHWRAQTEFL